MGQFERDDPVGLRLFLCLVSLIFDIARLCSVIPRLKSERYMPLFAVLHPSSRYVLPVVHHPDHVTSDMPGHPEEISSGQFSNLQKIVVVLDSPEDEEWPKLHLGMREEMWKAFEGITVSFWDVIRQ